MLLNGALIIVALLLMVFWIWGWSRALDKEGNTRERRLPPMNSYRLTTSSSVTKVSAPAGCKYRVD
jgi:hypothetical protein